MGFHLFGIDTHDSTLYGLVLHLGNFTIEEVADVICCTVKLDRFQTTVQSQPTMDDLALAARVRASLVDHHPRVDVTAEGGIVHIGLEGATSREQEQIERTVRGVAGVNVIDITFHPFTTPD